jgi:hypothetical protein
LGAADRPHLGHHAGCHFLEVFSSLRKARLGGGRQKTQVAVLRP